ncbi:MAG: type II toxin-antitoxin system RelE/ParE family toxin [Planctomycetia bacterium]|nr:type II toxin-antitoxin system RelE/ParE family toxin [Planctomycetia bacterium]
MSSFLYTPQAEADLDAITDYYAANNPDAGIRLLDEITARCQQLANQPRQGRPRNDLGSGIRSVVVRRYIIFFRAAAQGIDVLRVLHGARNITPDMFDE